MILIKNGKVVNPGGKEGNLHLLIKDNKIVKMERDIREKGARVIDANRKIVAPGLIDLHAHLREPGREDEETISQTCMAAARGGFTSICCMANTNPPIDNQGTVKFIKDKAILSGCAINIFPVGAISKGRKGEELAEIAELKEAGVVGLSDDGNCVLNALLMRRAFEYTKMFDLPLISHCEDKNLSKNGVMNEGYFSTVLGLPGIPDEAEEVMVYRDISLARMTEGKLHITHTSTRGSVELIRQAKRKKVKISADVTPHHLILTDEAVQSFDTNTKMNPPLRSREDIKALKDGLSDGTIDVIATDHAPHSREEKEDDFKSAPFGIVGLETGLALILTEIVDKGIITLKSAISKLSTNPAKILGLNKGILKKGGDADIIIIDPDIKWTITTDDFAGPCKNSPFIGREVKGRAIMTIVAGKIVFLHNPGF